MQIEVSITGVTPLLMNKFTDDAAMSATNGVRAVGLSERGTPREQAEKRLYLGLTGAPMIPQPNLLRCIVDAGAYFRAGRVKVTTQKSSLVPACVEIHGAEIPLNHKEPWSVDTRAVRIPATGGRILCHRPSFYHWEMDFMATLDTDLMTAALFRELIDAAGKRVGLGDYRPATKGPYGRFVVTRWHS